MSRASEATAISPTDAGARPRNLRRILTRTAIGLVILLLVVYLGVGAYAAHVLTLPDGPLDEANNPGLRGNAYQDVRFNARGNDVEIAAWYIPADDAENALVLVHGRDASRTAAFRGQFPDFQDALHDAGFAVLVIDLRGHGQSGDGRFSFGIKERYDVLGAVDWLLAEGYQPGSIGVLGISLGSAASIGAVAEEPAVGALVTDSAFAEIYPVVEAMWPEESGLPTLFLSSTLLMNRIMYGYHIPDAKPVDEIGAAATRPVLMIHCKTDADIPYAHFEQLQAAAPAAEGWLIPVCDHAEAYNAIPEEYSARVAAFFAANLD